MRRALVTLRHVRQARLAEVGEAGQARLEAALVPCIMHGFAAKVERTYLERSGVGVSDGPEPDEDAAQPEWLAALDPAAREVAGGAHAALTAIRAILGVR